ncbi:MAG: dihydroneopterin aldolase [Xanthomonadales bacterium]|jgi:dihydroneopterin aldolase|nr:dihydroneopterin aldolase [Xanthomonadales bacterium]
MSLSTLILRRLPIDGWLGETQRPIRLRLDLELSLANPRALRSGRPEDTLDAEDVVRELRDLARHTRAGVLEQLLCEFATTLLRRFPLRAVLIEGSRAAEPGTPWELAVRVQLDAASLHELNRLDAVGQDD